MVEPLATYRLQLHAGFGFREAAALAPYLAALGVSHLYSSPQLQATTGSSHGYDVVDPDALSRDLGGLEAHLELRRALRANDLGLLLDIVPNHMAITGPENRWWWDVLENGRASRFARYFDIEWDPPEARLRGRILLPVLGDQYGRVLERGDLQLARAGDAITVRYFDQSFPVAPGSMAAELGGAADHRPAESTPDATIAAINADPDRLHAILERQHYRLAYWRVARRDLGYRRFLGINSLIAVRVEDPDVFDATHRLILELVAAGVVDGLRVDHPGGLRDPLEYLRRLRERAPGVWLVVEKILGLDEQLRANWPVDGTVGYDFVNQVGGLFVDPAGEGALTDFEAELAGSRADFGDEVRLAKEQVLDDQLGSDLVRLTDLAVKVVEQHRRYRDYTRTELHDALGEAIACLPIYRTYIRAEQGEIVAEDIEAIGEAFGLVRKRRPAINPDLLDFLESILTLRTTGAPESELVMRFQQLAGPAMVKGAEDTAFYRYNRLVSLNEVGGDPGRFGIPVAGFHAFAERHARDWPRTMNATSTHDVKRGEDVRTRLAALSEMPDAWIAGVRQWRERNAVHRRHDWPDATTESLIYQTLVGAWPISVERLSAYLQKAIREAGVHTSWTAVDEAYEAAVLGYARAILDDPEFCADLEAFIPPIVRAGRLSSLSQLLIKLTAPGIPDIYQGTELWELTLVDPDNRRPVDFEARRALLVEIADVPAAAAMNRLAEGIPKLWLLRHALAARSAHPEAFGPGADYRPIDAEGLRSGNVVAFVRGGSAITVAPRLWLGLGDPPDWGDTRLALPAGGWRSVLTGASFSGTVPLATLLAEFPVALLIRSGDPGPH